MTARARVYRNIGRRQHYFGLEPIDALALTVILWALLTFNRGALAVNGLAVVLCYVALRVAKRGKPDGYTTDLLRYALSRRAFVSAAEPDVRGRAHPFLPVRGDRRGAASPTDKEIHDELPLHDQGRAPTR